jgi:hypothetical protein
MSRSLKASRTLVGNTRTSLRAVAIQEARSFPLRLSDLFEAPLPQERIFPSQVSADSVSGWCELTLKSNGHARFRGHLHDSGALTHNYYLFTVVKASVTPGRREIVVAHQGSVHGTAGFGSRDDDWDEQNPFWQPGVDAWPSIARAREHYTKISVAVGPIHIVEALVALGLPTTAVDGILQL